MLAEPEATRYPFKKILVTGASGFVASHLIPKIPLNEAQIIKIHSKNGPNLATAIERDWYPHLEQVDAVIHLAAFVHQPKSKNNEELCRQVNLNGTQNLALAARKMGVKRFLLMSSIKAAAESSMLPLTESMTPHPADEYGRSKLAAERLIASLNTDLFRTSSIRPPLVYGANVKANFAALLSAVKKQIPLPLGSIRNQRNLIYVENLVDAILTLLCSEKTGTYYVADQPSLSTPELIRLIAQAYQLPDPLFPFPIQLLNHLPFVGSKTKKLTESLMIDDSKFRTELSWTPPFTTQEAINKTVRLP